MTPPQFDITATVRAFAGGSLSRDAYWKQLQELHLLLEQYSELLARGQLRSIELSAAGLQVILSNGLRMEWDPRDLRTAPNILVNHGEYEPHELAAAERRAATCRTVFDIGANVGFYSLHFARLLRMMGGQVYAFEPVWRTFETLTRNIEINDYCDVVRPFNLALGEASGSVQLYVPEFSGSVAASQQPLFPDDANITVDVQMCTLDDFVAAHPIPSLDFIKCDVEGAELFVLRGGVKSIEKHRPVIMLEMLRKWARAFGYHPNDIISLLKPLGYTCWSLGASPVQFTEIDEACTETNFLFLPEDKS